MPIAGYSRRKSDSTVVIVSDSVVLQSGRSHCLPLKIFCFILNHYEHVVPACFSYSEITRSPVDVKHSVFKGQCMANNPASLLIGTGIVSLGLLISRIP